MNKEQKIELLNLLYEATTLNEKGYTRSVDTKLREIRDYIQAIPSQS